MITRSRAVAAAIATAVAICAAPGVRAADLDPVPSGYNMEATPVPTFLWTGVYAGVDAGYVFDNDSSLTTKEYQQSSKSLSQGTIGSLSPSLHEDGVTVGGHVGYNFQFGRAVVGVETDLAYTDLGTRSNVRDGSGSYSAGLDYLGTVRARAGYTFGNALFYGTGGLAYGGAHARLDGFNGTHSGSDVQLGYAAGGGVEFAVANDSFMNFVHAGGMTVRAEFLHYDLGTTELFGYYYPANSAGVTTNLKSKMGTEGNLGRVGVSYKF